MLGNKSLSQITADITSPLYARPKFWWIVGLGISSIMMLLGFWSIYVTIAKGIGTWGSTTRWDGDGPSSILCGGSGSVMPVRPFPYSF